jgi:hypothetical protein
MYQSKHAGFGEPVLFDDSLTRDRDEGAWQWPALPDQPS